MKKFHSLLAQKASSFCFMEIDLISFKKVARV